MLMKTFQSARICFVILTTSMCSLFGNIENNFEFLSYKDKDGALSKEFMKKLIDVFHPDIFFETGTYDGQTSINAAGIFDKVITVEIYRPLFEQIGPRFFLYSNIQRFFGNSSEVIIKESNQLNGTVLFWLDAHYSGGGTGKTTSAETGSPDSITAIKEELKAIHDAEIRESIILIDDIRDFGVRIKGHDFLACWAYPTVQEIKKALLEINPQFEIALLGDMLLAYDASKYHPRFSSVVEACTKTRLFDGYNLNAQELNELGAIIMNASPTESAFIEKLYNMKIIYNESMFWHDVWYGLIMLGQENQIRAKELFQSAYTRIQSVTSKNEAQKTFQSINQVWLNHSYDWDESEHSSP